MTVQTVTQMTTLDPEDFDQLLDIRSSLESELEEVKQGCAWRRWRIRDLTSQLNDLDLQIRNAYQAALSQKIQENQTLQTNLVTIQAQNLQLINTCNILQTAYNDEKSALSRAISSGQAYKLNLENITSQLHATTQRCEKTVLSTGIGASLSASAAAIGGGIALGIGAIPVALTAAVGGVAGAIFAFLKKKK